MKKLLTSLIVVVMLVAVVCGCVACSSKDPFDQVVDCAKWLQEKYGDSFEVAGDCGYQKYYTDEEDNTTYMYIYIAIQFKIVDRETGEEVSSDIAYFVGGSFVGYDSDWYNKTYEQWSDTRQLQFFQSLLIELDGIYTEVFTKEKVNSALGIGVVSGEVSGEAVSGNVSGEVA